MSEKVQDFPGNLLNFYGVGGDGLRGAAEVNGFEGSGGGSKSILICEKNWVSE